MLSLLNGGDVGGFFDYAHQAQIACGAAAVNARVDIRDVIANGAEAQIRFYVADRNGQRFGIIAGRAENVEGESLSGFAANPRQLLEFVDQASHWLCKFRHRGTLGSRENS
jgi:hypothetical protein